MDEVKNDEVVDVVVDDVEASDNSEQGKLLSSLETITAILNDLVVKVEALTTNQASTESNDSENEAENSDTDEVTDDEKEQAKEYFD